MRGRGRKKGTLFKTESSGFCGLSFKFEICDHKSERVSGFTKKKIIHRVLKSDYKKQQLRYNKSNKPHESFQ